MSRQLLDNWCERGILGLILTILVFGPLATGAVRTLDWLLVQGLTLGVVLLWVLRFWLTRNHRLLWPPICFAVVGFLIYAILRYHYADIEYVARLELIKVIVYAILFMAVLNNLYRQETCLTVVMVLVFLGMLLSLYAIYQYITDSPYVWHFVKPEQYMQRGSGTYICPNHLAGFLEMVLPLGITYMFAGRLNHVTKVFLGYASLVILVGIGVTISRGGWIATAISLLCLFIFLVRIPDYRKPALVGLILLAIGATGLLANLGINAQKRLQQSVASGRLADTRFVKIWRPALQVWQNNIWWGVGPDHFDHWYPKYRPADTHTQMRPARVHNDYLNTLVDWGIAGFLLVASAWVCLALGTVKTWKFVHRSKGIAAKNSNRFAFVLGSTIGLLAILIHSFVDFNMHIPANAILTVTLMGLLTSHLRYATDDYWVSPRWIGAVLATLLAGIALVYLGQQGLRMLKEKLWLDVAEETEPYSPEQIRALQNAYQIEPMNPQIAYKLGETMRVHSWQGYPDYREWADSAMEWLLLGMDLNPLDRHMYLRYGMCLHWIGRHHQAKPFMERALELDPNGYYTRAHMGWHYLEMGDLETAKLWFQKSLQLKRRGNPIALSYLRIVNRRLAERAGNPGREYLPQP